MTSAEDCALLVEVGNGSLTKGETMNNRPAGPGYPGSPPKVRSVFSTEGETTYEDVYVYSELVGTIVNNQLGMYTNSTGVFSQHLDDLGSVVEAYYAHLL